jgi:membrane fusion protein, copper/silver efflux system
MKQRKNIKAIIITASAIVLAVLAGYLIGKSGHNHSEGSGHQHAESSEDQTWTCSMHPQIRQQEPGDCPLCGMDLIPVATQTGSSSPFVHTMSEGAVALANIQTTRLSYSTPEHEVQLNGKIAVNEQRIAVISANYAGRIEKLFVDFTGQSVRRGEKLASIYSPELITAQKELQEAARFKDSNPSLYEAAREKLRLWKLTPEQISSIEKGSGLVTEFDVYADISGVVLRRDIARGDYITRGSVLFEVADLSQVWVLLEAYETDLPWLRTGQKIHFTTPSVPGKEFSSQITFIDPMISSSSRTVAIRANVENREMLLKPEMFVNAKIASTPAKKQDALMIPKTAILWTGKRSVVYLKTPDSEFPSFEMREITIGSRSGDFYLVEEGLSEGDELVTNGVFAVDAAVQLAGKVSMMNPEGGTTKSAHDHGQAQRANLKVTQTTLSPDAKQALHPLFESYLTMKDALVKDQFQEAKKALEEFQSIHADINMSVFTGEAHELWMHYTENLTEAYSAEPQTNNIEGIRTLFLPVSDIMIAMTKSFQPYKSTLYVQHCPMANKDQGADWLSLNENILNPYFGASMLTCGEVTGTIEQH